MNFRNNRTIQNAFWLISERIFYLSLSLVTLALIARYYGPEMYGTYNLSIAFVGLFVVLSTLGMENITVKHIVQKKAEEGTIIFTSLVVKLIGSVFLVLISIVVGFFIYPNNKLILVLISIISSSYLFKSFDVLEYWSQSYQKSKLTSLVRMFVQIITSILKIIIVLFKLNIIMLTLINIVETLLLAIGFYIVYKKHRSDFSNWSFNFEYLKILFSESWYFIVSGTMVALYTQFDKVILGKVLSNVEVGLYAAALAISKMWIFIPQALITSMQPIIMESKKKDEKLYYNAIEKLYSLIILISLLFGIIIIFIDEYVIKILYGNEYIEATNLLTISIWAVGFSLLGTARRIWLVCEEIQKYAIYFLSIGAVLSIVLNLIIIPYIGVEGAAITWLVVEITTSFIVPFFFKATRQNSFLILRALTFKTLIKK